jgi:hypothetical protein
MTSSREEDEDLEHARFTKSLRLSLEVSLRFLQQRNVRPPPHTPTPTPQPLRAHTCYHLLCL